jgi:MarR family transcriptional regulator, organic hydroperoxide resistance regulator
MKTDEQDRLVNEMMGMPMRFRRLIKVEEGQMMISPRHWVLKVLHSEGSMPMSSLARRMNVTKQYVTAIIAGLVEEELVERSPDTADRRIVIVSLTSKGEAALKACKLKIMEAFQRRIACLSEDDQERFLQAAREINSIISKMEDEK